MKKIPTLFERQFENGKVIGITPNVTPGMEWVLEGKGIATIKMDGACCAIIDGVFYKRFDAKPGRKIPEGAIPCCGPDPITGHWPHWVKVDVVNPAPADKWFAKAWAWTRQFGPIEDGTYEAIGPHFNGNPYNHDTDMLIKHGVDVVNIGRDFETIRDELSKRNIEGLVFWIDGEPQCKIKRTDFGLKWPL